MTGYALTFIQQKKCKDDTKHLYTRIYTFYSPVTKHKYVVLAEYFECNVFSIKFYSKRHRKSDRKYNFVINRGDIFKIIQTCIELIIELIRSHPGSSFGFIASRSIEQISEREEPLEKNQRHQVYKRYIARIGYENFDHYEFDNASAYLLVNNINSSDTESLKNSIVDMFRSTYPDLLDL